jgi:soluble P-type ATPase
MVLEGQEIRDRGIAGELLRRRAERMRGSRAEIPVGSLAGFQLLVADNLMQGPEIVLKGATTYTARVTDTAHGTIRSVEHAIQHLEDVAENLVRGVADARKRLADTQAQVGVPFEYATRLADLVQRQQAIEDELDLTKNQASAQLEAEAANDPPTTEPGPDSLKEDYDDA